MSSPHEQALEGGGLRVRFRFAGDRYGHEIWLADGSSWVHALSSVEGNAQQIWPDSPPLQSLHLESGCDGQPIALLVGMAGQSHWSASIELDAGTPRLHFDVACRVASGHSPSLGSCYRGTWPLALGDARAATFMATNQPGRGVLIEANELIGDTHLRHSPDCVVIAPLATGDHDASRTIRWAYTITVISKG
jgi:hypothetical protein